MINLDDRKIFSGKRASEGLSSNFKSSSRDKNAFWGNRFVRDHNDLNYNADPNSISNRLRQSAKIRAQKNQNQDKNPQAKKYQYSPIKQRQQARTSQSQRNGKKGLNIDNYISTSVQQLQKAKRTYQQTAATSKRTRFIDERDNVNIEPFNDYDMVNGKEKHKHNFAQQNIEENVEYEVKPKQQINLLGLSQFEFETTLHGKLLSKSNHHIDYNFSKTQKITNVIKHWYDNSKDIQKSQDTKAKEKAYSLQRIHSFKSDSAHNLFHRTNRILDDNGCGNGGMHPQYYDITSPEKYDVNHFRTTKDTVDYCTMTPRPDFPKKLGTNLVYSVQSANTMGIGNLKKPVMEMSHSARKLVFTRQVISPKRGCFR